MINLYTDYGLFPSRGNVITLEMYSTLNYLALKHNKGDLGELKNSYKLESLNYSNILDKENLSKLLIDIPENGINIFFPGYSNNSNRLPSEDFNIDGWRRLNIAPYPIEQFLQKYKEGECANPCAIFVDEKGKRVAFFFNSQFRVEIYDGIRSVLFRICCWLYPNGKLDNDDIAYFKAISENNSNEENKICNKLIEKKELYSYYLKTKFQNWNNSTYDSQIENSLNDMNDAMTKIREYERCVYQAQSKYENSKILYESLISTRPEDDDSICKFLLNRKNYIIPHHVEKAVFNYDIITTLEFYDLEAFNRLYDNKKSSVYSCGERAAKVMKGVFKDRLGIFQVECEFEARGLTAITPYVRNNYLHDNTVFHPHINGHACLGGNDKYIKEYLRNGELEQAIDQTVAAAKNINFGDAVVMKTFARYINSSMNRPFIKTNNGFISPTQLLKIMEEKENENNG